ncbi:AraC family transcriptional regulator [Flavonifractor plautii]|nr:AraC family transcriptional regulator [Flavonifractor plautii]
MLEQVLRERRSRHSRPIETALSYIHAHYAQPISMAEVAAQLYRSPEHFSRQFKEEVGENFSSYLTRYRLERAQELLQTTDLPVASVAVQTGYTTPDTFPGFTKVQRRVPGGGAPGVKIVTKNQNCDISRPVRKKISYSSQKRSSLWLDRFVFFVKLNL